jgi:NADPH:quinone reductase-like Zn-dependent oxidoreductase
MRAAVIRALGSTPTLEQFPDPQPGPGLSVGTLVAAALNPLDLALVNDLIPFRRLQPPYVAGYEGVVELGDGARCYLGGPPAPDGTLAELVPVPDSVGFPVPAGIDPGLAAALGVAGIVDLTDDDAIDAGLASAAPGGYDVILDFLWGAPAPHAIDHAHVGARYIQLGSSAGPASVITASAIRNKLLTLAGQGMVGTPDEARRSAYAELMRHAVDGKLTLDLEQTRLDDISETWGLLKAGPPRKLVVTP